MLRPAGGLCGSIPRSRTDCLEAGMNSVLLVMERLVERADNKGEMDLGLKNI